jgi:hypothetical protein
VMPEADVILGGGHDERVTVNCAPCHGRVRQPPLRHASGRADRAGFLRQTTDARVQQALRACARPAVGMIVRGTRSDRVPRAPVECAIDGSRSRRSRSCSCGRTDRWPPHDASTSTDRMAGSRDHPTRLVR